MFLCEETEAVGEWVSWRMPKIEDLFFFFAMQNEYD